MPRFFPSRLSATIALAASLTPSLASAATTPSRTSSVNMVILNQCEISGSPGGGAAGLLDFGSHDALSVQQSAAATPSSRAGAVTVTCNAATSSATLAFSLGQNASGATRQLASGSSRIAYQIYQDAGYSQPIGATAISLGAFTNGGSVNFPVYGRLPSLGGVPAAGNYTDQLTMTLSF